MTKLTSDQVNQIIKLYREGAKVEYLAARFGVNSGTIRYHKRKIGLYRNPQVRPRKVHTIAITVVVEEEISTQKLIQQINDNFGAFSGKFLRADSISRRGAVEASDETH